MSVGAETGSATFGFLYLGSERTLGKLPAFVLMFKGKILAEVALPLPDSREFCLCGCPLQKFTAWSRWFSALPNLLSKPGMREC